MMNARRFTPALAVLAASALLASPATAHLARPEHHSFATSGIQISAGIAVDEATGEVYVAGLFSSNLERFSATGVHEPAFAPTLQDPWGVAVDNSSDSSKGDIYVSELGNDKVLKLDPSGQEVAGFTTIEASSIPGGDAGSGEMVPQGIAVDPANGNVIVADSTNQEVDIFTSEGAFVSQFKGGGSGVAVGPGSEIYTASDSGLQAWSASDGYSTPTTIDPSDENGVAADAASGDAFADDNSHIAQYDDTGAPLMQFGDMEFSLAVAVDEATGAVYVFEDETERVEVWGPAVTLPDVDTGAASEVTSTGASLSGTVNPEQITVDSCIFEYGLNKSYGASVGCVPPSPLTGVSPIAVSTPLSGLQPNATYHYRLATNSANGPSDGEDETFQTEPAAPSLDDVSASAVTQTTATLDASINPNNQASSYQFEFGPESSYGTTLPAAFTEVGSGYGDVVVAQQLSGLTPGSTYHFRVIVRNATGTTTGTDETFTTPGPTPPIATTAAAGEVSTTSATITGTVDPQGVQTTYEFDLGTDTSYGTRLFATAGSGTEAETVSVSLQGLTPGTTYHYRLVATNLFGQAVGADGTFTTPTVLAETLTAPPGAMLIPAPPFPSESVSSGGATTSKAAVHGKKPKRKKKGKARKSSRRAKPSRAHERRG